MSGIDKSYERIETKEQFLDLIFKLLDENDAIEWKNDTSYSFLQAMAAWLVDADGFYENMKIEMDTSKISWQLIADALQAAIFYE